MKIIEHVSPKLSEPLGIYSQAIEVSKPERLIFVSGFTSRDKEGNVVGKDDIKVQTDNVLTNMKHILEEAGATMNDVVKMTLYIKDMNMFDEIHEVRAKYFDKPYPACAMLEVSRMVSPEHLIEIEAIAAVKENNN